MTVFVLAAALSLGATQMAGPILAITRSCLAADPMPLDISSAVAMLRVMALTVGQAALLPLALVGLGGLVVGLAQTRFQIATKAFEAKLDHLDPMATFQRLFLSRQPFVELLKGLLQIGALGAITGSTIAGHAASLPQLAGTSPAHQLQTMEAPGIDLVARAFPVMAILAAVDYGFSYYTWWQKMRRSDQQLKDDHKESEGDPYVKMRRRRRMRDLSA